MLDFTEGWGLLVSIGGGFLLLAAIVREIRTLVGWLGRKRRPLTAPAGAPTVTLGAISASVSLTHDVGEPHRRLASIRPRYEVQNDGELAVTKVRTGFRERGTYGGGWQFEWSESIIPPHSAKVVDGVEIPPEKFRGVHESVAQRAFTFWVRFTDHRGQRWEVSRDAETGQHEWLFNPESVDPGGEATSGN